MAVKAKKKRRHINWKKTIAIYVMMLPGMLYFLFNNYLPMAGITIAFRRINYRLGIWMSPFCGLENFEFLFESGSVFIMIRNTILYNAVFIVLGTVLAIATAILLNEVRQKILNRTYQTLILLPYLMSMVVVSYLAYAFLSGENGYINNTILPLFGIDTKIAFYQEPKYWPFILTFVHLWKSIGFNMVIYLAAVIGISPDYYEAARIDGANKWKQITNITIPLLVPTIITLFILSVGRIFYSDFGLFYQVPRNSGTLYNVTQTIDTFVYNALMNQNNISMSSAAGFIQSVVGCCLVLVANGIIRKISRENAMF